MSNNYMSDVSFSDINLITSLKEAERRLYEARDSLNHVLDDELIDYYIYEVKALEMKYDYLLKKVKDLQNMKGVQDKRIS